jgi:hypothetical protein
MSMLIRNMKNSVKESARDLAGLAAGAAIAAVFTTVACFFFAWALYMALAASMSPIAAAVLVGILFLLLLLLVYFLVRMRSIDGGMDEPVEGWPMRETNTAPWAAYGIPADWPVDKIARQLKILGLGALARFGTRYSTRTVLPLVAPTLVGIAGFMLVRKLTARTADRRSDD